MPGFIRNHFHKETRGRKDNGIVMTKLLHTLKCRNVIETNCPKKIIEAETQTYTASSKDIKRKKMFAVQKFDH